jgi:hypothetical protein
MPTYYVRPTNGSDGNSGLTFALAFQTFQKALDTAVASDVIRLCPEATETTAVAVDWDTNAGTTLTPIIIETGNTTDGSRDMSLTYTIQASAAMTGLATTTAAADYYKCYNVIFDANSNATHALYNNVDSSDRMQFHNCRFTGSTGDNVNVRGTSPWQFYDCENDNGGADGYGQTAGGRGALYLRGGSVHDNVGDGITGNDNHDVQGVEIYNNGAYGWDIESNGGGSICIGNTFYNNTLDALRFYSADTRNNYTVYDNTLSSNGGYGFNFQGLTTNIAYYMDYNHTDGNTLGASDVAMPGDNNVTGAPNFTNVGAGTENFIPLSTSVLVRAGLMGRTIGARQSADPAGGGGGMLVNPKMSGGMS